MASMVEQMQDPGSTAISTIIEQFRKFLNNYYEPSSALSATRLHGSSRGLLSNNSSNNGNGASDATTETPKYVGQARDMALTQTLTMYINYHHLDPEDDGMDNNMDDDSDDDSDDDHSDLINQGNNNRNKNRNTKNKNHHQRRFFTHEQLQYFLQNYHIIEAHLTPILRDFLSEVVPEYVPKDDQRQFAISIFNFRTQLTVRALQPEIIGQLVAIRAMATKSTKVSPEVSVGAFKCRDCGTIIKNVKQEFKITLPPQCTGNGENICNNKRFFDILPQYSTFTDWQQLTVQESTEQLPAGSVPRTIKVILRGELVEVAKPGDQCIITGVLLSIPDVAQLYSRTEVRSNDNVRDGENPKVSGLKDLGVREMAYKTVLLASNITRLSGTGATPYPDSLIAQLDGIDNYQQALHGFEASDITAISELTKKRNLSQILVNSIAPNVYGHDLVKKGILFMILGGVHKVTKDRTSLRGDINVLLIGDPSTAKSQFLKFVTDFLPRVVYTSGKSSTAAGLTASVTRDSDTGEFVIEAGALMLADNGVCCIDEFDKMDQKDQSAIHEAMEQQTISIAKAGIQATLNARTSILAAANPLTGRYDTTKTLKQNVNITPPIMSRFDLYFILVDQPNSTNDRSIAKHMISSHVKKVLSTRKSAYSDDLDQAMTNLSINEYLQTVPSNSSNHQFLPVHQLRSFIRYARQLDPQLSDPARELIVKTYGDLRQRDLLGNSPSSYKVTVRQLESLIRLSQACARMYLATEVSEDHVREAAELLNRSIVNVKQTSTLIDLGFGGDDDDDNNDGDDSDGDNNDSEEEDGMARKKSDDKTQGDSIWGRLVAKKGANKGKSTAEPAQPMKRRRGQALMGDDDDEEEEQQPQRQEEEQENEASTAQQVSTEDYNRIVFEILHHLEEIRDDRITQQLKQVAEDAGVEENELDQDQIEKTLQEKPFIISPPDLLSWLVTSNTSLTKHISAKYRDALKSAQRQDEEDEVDTNMAALESKMVKYKKKVFKLVLRRMLSVDRTIINREGSIEVHPDYSATKSLRDNGTDTKLTQKDRRVNAYNAKDDVLFQAPNAPVTKSRQNVTQYNDEDERDVVMVIGEDDNEENVRPKAKNGKVRPNNRKAKMGDDDDDEDEEDVDSHLSALRSAHNVTSAAQSDDDDDNDDNDDEEEEQEEVQPRRSARSQASQSSQQAPPTPRRSTRK